MEGAPSVSFQCGWAAGQPWAGHRGRRQCSRQVGEGQKSKTRYNVVVSFQGRSKADDFECRRCKYSQLFGSFVFVVAAGSAFLSILHSTLLKCRPQIHCVKKRWD
jgi:hypothetical protein